MTRSALHKVWLFPVPQSPQVALVRFLTVTFALEVLLTTDAATAFRHHPWVCREGK